jgi:hypothetical protein
VPPVPHEGLALNNEIRCHRHFLLLDLWEDPTYALNSPTWDTFEGFEWDPQRHVGLLGNTEWD